MKFTTWRRRVVGTMAGVALWVGGGLGVGVGTGAGAAEAVTYTLLPGSTLQEICLPCVRPTVAEPLRGTMEVRVEAEHPLWTDYVIERVRFSAGGVSGREYAVRGAGTWRMGGEVAVQQTLVLSLEVDAGTGVERVMLTNGDSRVTWRWPMLEADLGQTNPPATQLYQLRLVAAPVADLWFSTGAGLTSARWNSPTNRVSGGDWLSWSGRVVRRSSVFTSVLGLMPSPVPADLGLDAADVLPGGEVVFSIEQDVFSETLGSLQHGDLLSSAGRVVRRNQSLTAAFWQMPPAPDAGLDAVQVLPGGEVLFSIERAFFSELLGVQVRPGDLLSSRGQVVRRNAELLARFKPVEATRDYGLDALHVWPSGEIWFSVETGFQGSDGAAYGPGDLLSDEGRVVVRNLDLVSEFQPLEDLADFGCDSLFVVTSLGAAPVAGPALTRIQPGRSLGSVGLEWRGEGRVWQIERAGGLDGVEWSPISPVVLERAWVDGAPPAGRGFYRVRQW